MSGDRRGSEHLQTLCCIWCRQTRWAHGHRLHTGTQTVSPSFVWVTRLLVLPSPVHAELRDPQRGPQPGADPGELSPSGRRPGQLPHLEYKPQAPSPRGWRAVSEWELVRRPWSAASA